MSEGTTVHVQQLTADLSVLSAAGIYRKPTAITANWIATQASAFFSGALLRTGVLRKSMFNQAVIEFRASYAERPAANRHQKHNQKQTYLNSTMQQMLGEHHE